MKIQKATITELKAARNDPRQLPLLPSVTPEELDAIRTVLAVAGDQVDRAVTSGLDTEEHRAAFYRARRMVIGLVARLEAAP